jgi:site-specific DNA-methyltransferase (cytosine-N4-specific)
VAFALRDECGLYLRADIIWHKPNPMPESVTERTTRAHEYPFLLTKQEDFYYGAGRQP